MGNIFNSDDIKYFFDGDSFNFGCVLLLIGIIIGLSVLPAAGHIINESNEWRIENDRTSNDGNAKIFMY